MAARNGRTLVLSTLLVVLCTASACSDPPPPPPRPPGALALVVGARNNMPAPVIDDDLRGTLVEGAIRSGDKLVVVDSSGRPREVFTGSLASDCDSGDACEYAVEDSMNLINQKIAEARATAPEADPLGAIATAAEAIRGTPPDRSRQIVVIDNGLQTSGEIRLQTPRAVFSDPDEVANRLREGGRLPDLQGIKLTWVGIGSAADPQPAPDQRPRDNLQALWQKVLAAAGAEVTFAGSLPAGAPPAAPDLPPVSVVDVADRPLPIDDLCPTLFDDQIGFLPDQPVLRDPTRANSVLAPLARGIAERRQAVRLVGYVAKPEAPGPGALSQRRADVVLGLLVGLGVPRPLLTAEGRGLAPEAQGGTSSPEALAQYRRVEIVGGGCGGAGPT